MRTQTLKRKHGFTLVELLVAIAVIGILISLLIPAVGKVMESARRAKGANNVKQIVLAYKQYLFDDVNERSIDYNETGISATVDRVKNLKEFAIVLARKGYLNDPNVYCFSGDSGADKPTTNIIVPPGNIQATTTNAWEKDTPVFSVVVAIGIKASDPATTPIVFTRGIRYVQNSQTPTSLDPDGLYKGKGAYIGFLDGHVEWFEKFDYNSFVHNANGTVTGLIMDALPNRTSVAFIDGTGKVFIHGAGGSGLE